MSPRINGNAQKNKKHMYLVKTYGNEWRFKHHTARLRHTDHCTKRP